MTTLVIEPTEKNAELLMDFGILAEDALPIEFQQWIGNSELPFFPQLRAPFADVIFDVNGHRFLCHKAFFCSRSEYFKTMLRDPFAEQSSSWNLPVIFVRNVAPIIFVQVLYYIYRESVEVSKCKMNSGLKSMNFSNFSSLIKSLLDFDSIFYLFIDL